MAKNRFNSILDSIERVGNRLLAWIVIITIWVFAGFPLGFDGPLYLS